MASLERPRKVLIMVKAGAGVDAVIAGLAPLLDEGDLIMDGGNSYYRDTERRSVELAAQNLNFMGVGISGGEEARCGGRASCPAARTRLGAPSRICWRRSPPRRWRTASRALPTWGRGAGHYVKMVHNGIEYGDMQLIAEAYAVLQGALG